MKKFILIFLVTFISVSAQNQKVIMVSNNLFNGGSTVPQTDSLIKNLNSIDGISLIIFSGSLTTKGTKQQFESLNQSLTGSAKPFVLFPFGPDCREYNGWNTFLENWNDDKFVFDDGKNIFIGINPTLPYTTLNFYSQEKIEWLKTTLDDVDLSKDIYFISPLEFEKITGWQIILDILNKKNVKLILCGSTSKFKLRNLYGTNILEVPGSFTKVNENLNYTLIDISKDRITVSDNYSNKIIQIDKTIFLVKEKINLNNFSSVNSTIEALILQNQNMYSEPLWWNSKIYTAQESGIISCFDSTGKFLWDYDTYGDIISTPVIEDRILAAATLQGDIITLSAINGEQIQSIGFEETITTDLLSIKYEGDKELMIPKLTKSENAIVFGTASGKLFCYDLETLQEYWVNKNSKGMIRSKPISVGNKILFTSNDGFMYCIDSRNGLLNWRWKEKADTDFYESKLLSDGKLVYSISNDGIVYAIDLLLGKLVWKLENQNAQFCFSLSKDKKYLFIKSGKSKILTILADKGKIQNGINISEGLDDSQSDILELGSAFLLMNNGSIQTLDNKSRTDKLIFVDYSPGQSLKKINEKKFMASNYNGTIILFSPR